MLHQHNVDSKAQQMDADFLWFLFCEYNFIFRGFCGTENAHIRKPWTERLRIFLSLEIQKKKRRNHWFITHTLFMVLNGASLEMLWI